MKKITTTKAALGLLIAFTGLTSSVAAMAGGAEADWRKIVDPRDFSQGPEGSWLYDVKGLDSTGYDFEFLGTETYAAGGGYTEADQLGFTPGLLAQPGHGGWRMIGEKKFLLTYVNLTYNDKGVATGSGKVRQTTKISTSGNTYVGSGDYFYYDSNNAVVDHGTFTITAKRIQVEAPK